jgi:hypothetical protein
MNSLHKCGLLCRAPLRGSPRSQRGDLRPPLGLDRMCVAHVAMAALHTVLAALRPPEPCARLALPRFVEEGACGQLGLPESQRSDDAACTCGSAPRQCGATLQRAGVHSHLWACARARRLRWVLLPTMREQDVALLRSGLDVAEGLDGTCTPAGWQVLHQEALWSGRTLLCGGLGHRGQVHGRRAPLRHRHSHHRAALRGRHRQPIPRLVVAVLLDEALDEGVLHADS